MKYIKRLVLNSKSPSNDRFSVNLDGSIVTNSTNSLQVPVGTTDQRPSIPQAGQIRYNTTIGNYELYSPLSSKWEESKQISPGVITVATLGVGDYITSVFGPLIKAVNENTPQNILVFVENVYQIPFTNYILVKDPAPVVATVSNLSSIGSTVIYVSSVDNINLNSGIRTVTGFGIPSDTTLVDVSTDYDVDNLGFAITLSNPITESISDGTVISVAYPAGTYISFSEKIPNKTITALFGFDGNA